MKLVKGKMYNFEGVGFVHGKLVDIVKAVIFEEYRDGLAVVFDEEGKEYEVKASTLSKY